MFEFAKEVYSDEKTSGNKSDRDESPDIMASGFCTVFYQKNLKNYLIEKNYHYKENKLEKFLTHLMEKPLQKLINH